MPDAPSLADVHEHTVAAYESVLDRLRGLDASKWEAPTVCPGWTVTDLAHHLVGVADSWATALDRLARGDATPNGLTFPNEHRPDVLVEMLAEATRRLDAAYAANNDDTVAGRSTLPWGPTPGTVATAVPAADIGVHETDLVRALGEDAELRDGLAPVAIYILGVFLPLLGGRGERPSAPLSYRLTTPSGTLDVAFNGSGWQAGSDEGDPTAVIAGSESAIALFGFGRLPSSDARLSVAGDETAATNFKRYLPGP